MLLFLLLFHRWTSSIVGWVIPILHLSDLLAKFHMPCSNNRSTPSVCEACQKGKHVRLPFATSLHNTYFPFQFIHYDLWTSPTESVAGFKYYLIVIDDFS
jgi:hypothetical protein